MARVLTALSLVLLTGCSRAEMAWQDLAGLASSDEAKGATTQAPAPPGVPGDFTVKGVEDVNIATGSDSIVDDQLVAVAAPVSLKAVWDVSSTAVSYTLKVNSSDGLTTYCSLTGIAGVSVPGVGLTADLTGCMGLAQNASYRLHVSANDADGGVLDRSLAFSTRIPSVLALSASFPQVEYLDTKSGSILISNPVGASRVLFQGSVLNGGPGFLAVSTGGATECGVTLESGMSCTQLVNFTSPGNLLVSGDITMSYLDGTGPSLKAVNLPFSAQGIPKLVDVKAPSGNTRWMTFSKMPSGAGDRRWDILSSNVPCAGNEPRAADCVHSGQMRYVDLPGQTDCVNLAFSDALGVFDWDCVMAGSFARLQQKRFAKGKGLGHLLLPTGGWANQVISVTKLGVEIFRSPFVQWWDDPTQVLTTPVSPAQDLGGSGTIYIIPSNRTADGFNLKSDSVGLVALPGVQVVSSLLFGNPNCDGGSGLSAAQGGSVSMNALICAGNRRFLWIEGIFQAGGGTGKADTGIYLLNVAHSYLRTVRITQAANFNLALFGSFANRLHGVDASKGDYEGVYFDNAHGNDLIDFRASQNLDNGIMFYQSDANRVSGAEVNLNGTSGFIVSQSLNNILHGVRASSNTGGGIAIVDSQRTKLLFPNASSQTTNGILLQGGSDTTVVGALASGNQNSGIQLAAGMGAITGTTLHLVTAANNGIAATPGRGVWVNGSNGTVSSTTMSNLLAVNNYYGLAQTNGATNSLVWNVAAFENTTAVMLNNSGPNQFRGFLRLSTSSVCSVALGTNPGLTGTGCAISGSSDASVLAGGTSDNAFIGKIVVGDATNPDDNAVGVGATVTNWSPFDSPWRAWGRDSGTYPSNSVRGACLGTGCHIWDWRLSDMDALFRNVSGDGLNQNGTFAATQACPSQADGSIFVSDQQSTSNQYLMNAFERPFDNIGDDDGLCEDNESCVYAPNLGGYQGEGGLDYKPCVFSDGVVRNVKLWGYLQNGTQPNTPVSSPFASEL